MSPMRKGRQNGMHFAHRIPSSFRTVLCPSAFCSADVADELGGAEKRAGGRAFLPAEEEKRAGGRAFSRGEDKRGGARTFQPKRAGGRAFNFHPDEKRAGARPFVAFAAPGFGDGMWMKRAGGRYFARQFGDNSGFGGYGWAGEKRGGGRTFSSMWKRGGGRSFFGGMDGLYDNANYWAPQPIAKYPRRSMLYSPPSAEEEEAVAVAPAFYYDAKRGGARAFSGDDDDVMGLQWEKRAGGRSFAAGQDNEEANDARR